MSAHKGRTPYEIEICTTCLGFIVYGTTGDWSTREHSETQLAADRAHARMMTRRLGVTLAHVSEGCGASCPDHGVAAYDSEAAYETALEVREVEPWFSNSPCEGCGAEAGTREHATMWVK